MQRQKWSQVSVSGQWRKEVQRVDGHRSRVRKVWRQLMFNMNKGKEDFVKIEIFDHLHFHLEKYNDLCAFRCVLRL